MRHSDETLSVVGRRAGLGKPATPATLVDAYRNRNSFGFNDFRFARFVR